VDKDDQRLMQAFLSVRSEIQGWGDTFRFAMENIQMTLDDLRLKIQNESSVIDSVLTMVKDLRDKLAAIGSETPVDAAKVNELASLLDANAAKLAAAVTVNTVAEPEGNPEVAATQAAAAQDAPAPDPAPVSVPPIPTADPSSDTSSGV